MSIPIELLKQDTVPVEPEIVENFNRNTDETAPPPEVRRSRMINTVAPEDPINANERFFNLIDLLPINYLLIGYQKSRAVGRIAYFDLVVGRPAVATGFLISSSLVMTNHHVFGNIGEFRDSKIEFNYEFDLAGNEREKIIFNLRPDKFFFSDKDLDFAILAVEESDTKNQTKITSRGYIVLNPNFGKIGMNEGATIIQHPEGNPLQIALRDNQISRTDHPSLLFYKTDTARGSSGAAVFNDQWQLIALHSAGDAKQNAQGEYVDKDDKVIPVINGKIIEENRIVWLNNRGIRISAIITKLSITAGVSNHPLISILFSSTYSDEKPLAFLALPSAGNENFIATPPAPPQTPLLVSGLPTPSSPQVININILVGDKQLPSLSGVPISITQPSMSSFALGFEKKYEDEMDFSSCKGYNEYFMDEQVPIPTPTEKLKKKIAFLIDNPNQYILKYHHYSTIHHAVRRMPVVSAINIMGKRRYVELEGRNDKWFRDRRIDYDIQLNDEFYKYSGFDRGHMCRREDAEWGTTMAFAEIAANMTCAYPNAVPQVPELNRGSHGYTGEWGLIEKEILEKGVVKESGQEGRICVFNGPIFDEDDPHFKGIQIPMQFFKVVVWRNPSLAMKATAYKLSQEKLVSEIEFERLRFDEIFKHRQIAISSLEQLTGLRFNRIRDWDTFQARNPGEFERLVVGEDITNMIEANK